MTTSQRELLMLLAEFYLKQNNPVYTIATENEYKKHLRVSELLAEINAGSQELR